MSVFDLLKSHVDAYTRKDGVTVTAHDDKRVAAQPNLGAVAAKHHDAFDRKASDWNGTGKKIPASDIPSGAPEFSHKEVYGHDRTTSPAGDDFADGFKPPQHFVVKHNDGSRNLVNTEGYGYARYHAAIDGEKAALETGAKPTDKKKAKPAAPAEGEAGHEEFNKYGAYFKKGDKVKDNYGKPHEVLSHRGPEVHTTGGSYHPTKLHRA